MFMRPFGKPWVIVADFREAQDIQTNRQHEFDRSTYIGEVFGPLLPGNHVWVCLSSFSLPDISGKAGSVEESEHADERLLDAEQ